MRAKVFGSIETLSREISAPMRLVPLGEGDFSTPLRFGRNDNEAGEVFVLICSLQTNDKASTAKLSNYPVRNQSFFHSLFFNCSKLHMTKSIPFPVSHRHSGSISRQVVGAI